VRLALNEMAEVFGIVSGVLGLLPLCRGESTLNLLLLRVQCLTDCATDGLGMIKDVFDATNVLQLAVGRVELQRDVSKLLRHPTLVLDNTLT
jgi:hypothetical protein